ncbi:hypothetical protein JXB31_01790 [Candidatus Woesearchaeota archaeon]|nr:hypothetical protein [Candidatus Woesearchaeota archaeon]
MGEWWFRIRDFFRYTPAERRDMILSVIIISLAFAYDDKRETFNLLLWLSHYIYTVLIVTVTLFVHTAVQKLLALHQGFLAEYKAWPLGLALTVIFSIVSNGSWFVLLFGGMSLVHVPILRIGKWRYGFNLWTQGLVAASGAIANLVVATICLAIGVQMGIFPEFFTYVASVNFWVLIFSLLPLPNMDGIHLFFISRLVYVFVFTSLLAYVIMSSLHFYSWIFALLIGGVCWLLFYIFFER